MCGVNYTIESKLYYSSKKLFSSFLKNKLLSNFNITKLNLGFTSINESAINICQIHLMIC